VTAVEICNQALSLLGHDRLIKSLNANEDASTEAMRCASFYSGAKKRVLSAHPWAFGIMEANVSTSEANVPIGFVRSVAFVDKTTKELIDVRTYVKDGKIKAQQAATMFYSSAEISENQFPEYVCEAIVHELAYRLYTPIVGIPTSEDSCKARDFFAATAQSKLQDAINIDIANGDYTLPQSDSLDWGNEGWARNKILCNAALKIAGSTRSITHFQYDLSPEADACRTLYTLAVRKVLGEHAWRVCNKTIEVENAEDGKMELPKDFVRLVAASDSQGLPVHVEVSTTHITAPAGTKVVYASEDIDLESGAATYIRNAIVYALAASLLPVVAADEGAASRVEGLLKVYADEVNKAKIEEAESVAYLAEPTDIEALAKLDIANKAMTLAGSGKTIFSLTEDHSIEAARFKLIYPSALRAVMYAHTWDFATRTSVRVMTPDINHSARWSLPSDIARIVSVTGRDNNPLKYHRDGDVLIIELDTMQEVRLRYMEDVALSQASPAFLEVVAVRVAASIAPSLGVKDTTRLEEMYTRKLAEFKSSETSDTEYGGESENPFLAARRG
jgi:hypothetical protein